MPQEFRIVFSGQVQGVFFRSKIKQHADRLGLRGMVRNLPNGDVEVRLAGTKKEADELIEAMQREPSPIQISSIDVSQLPCLEPYEGFKIVY